MNIQKNKELCSLYPFLVPRNVWTDEVADGYDYSWTEMDMIPTGWRIAFGEMMMEEIAEALKKTGNLETFRFDEIKEKFGSLRVYTHGGNEEVDEIIDNYSYLSENICIVCGKPDVYMTSRGWIYPCCRECWEKREKPPYSQSIEGEDRMADTRIFRRSSPETGEWVEHVVDISETANKIRERWEKNHEEV